MTSTTTARRTGRSPNKRRAGAPVWLRLIRGLGVSVLVTIAGVAIFALLMQWIRPADGTVRIFNQVLKLLSIGAGVYVAVGRGQEGGLLRGALVGLLYMAVAWGCTRCCPGRRRLQRRTWRIWPWAWRPAASWE